MHGGTCATETGNGYRNQKMQLYKVAHSFVHEGEGQYDWGSMYVDTNIHMVPVPVSQNSRTLYFFP